MKEKSLDKLAVFDDYSVDRSDQTMKTNRGCCCCCLGLASHEGVSFFTHNCYYTTFTTSQTVFFFKHVVHNREVEQSSGNGSTEWSTEALLQPDWTC